MIGTVRTMGQVGAVHAYLVLRHGLTVLYLSDSLFWAILEAYVMLQICHVLAMRVGYRFAGLA